MGNLGSKPALVALTSGDLGADIVTAAKIADDVLNSEHYAAGSIDNEHLADNAAGTDEIADNAVTLAKMAGGTDGNIISYDASGDPVAIATGSDGQVLTSAGAGAPPAFEAAAAGGKVLQVICTTKVDTYTVSLGDSVVSSANITGLDVVITPTATSSRILLSGHILLSTTNPDVNSSVDVQLLVNGSLVALANGAAASSRTRCIGAVSTESTYESGTFSFSIVDVPNSTSELTYGFRLHNNRGATATICVNRTGNDSDAAGIIRGASAVVAQEISG
jgi:hypothetical protein